MNTETAVRIRLGLASAAVGTVTMAAALGLTSLAL